MSRIPSTQNAHSQAPVEALVPFGSTVPPPKRFLKRYRTEIAASSSSVMSTILSVSPALYPAASREPMLIIVITSVPAGLGEDENADIQIQQLRRLRSQDLPDGEDKGLLSRYSNGCHMWLVGS